jgi:hypothetical protein
VACRDVIGVYEPLVSVLGVVVRHTSLAVEPSVAAADGALYHRSCFERVADDNVGAPV